MGKITMDDIVLFNKPPYHRPGDDIEGVCVLNVTEKVKIKGFTITLYGSSEVRLNKGLCCKRKVNNNEDVYVNEEYDVGSAENGLFGKFIPQGRHEIPFHFTLPSSYLVETLSPNSLLPSSFESKFCSTRYMIKAEILRPWYKRDIRQKTSVPVVAPTFSPNPETLMGPLANEAKSDKWGRFSLRAEINKQAFCPGELIRIKADIENLTNDTFTPKLEIRERASCFTRSRPNDIWIKGRIVSKSHGTPMGKTDAPKRTSLHIKVPVSCRSVRDCRLINNEYFVRVTLEFDAILGQNIYVDLPIFIGDMPESGPLVPVFAAMSSSTPVPTSSPIKLPTFFPN